MAWWQVRTVRWALAVGLLLRLVPMLAWIRKPCFNDECTYFKMAEALVAGEGIVATEGWLWAPGYPAVMALPTILTGHPGGVQVIQLVAAGATAVALYRLTERLSGSAAARVAIWMFALNPTFAFYTISLWSEALYTALLLAAVAALGWAREGDARRGWAPGVLIGCCMLFRGVATYMLPIFVVGLLFERWRAGSAWRGATACVLGVALTVTPYSLYASNRWGGLVVTDRTLGQMMWLGNNTFPPMTFDYGNGVPSPEAYETFIKKARPHCGFQENPLLRDQCEVGRARKWIEFHPVAFLSRVPLRLSQLLTPHSFLTRHVRMADTGLARPVTEAVVVWSLAFTFFNLVVGTVGWFARRRDWYTVTAGLIVLYHLAAVALTAGLSRYRVPLEPLWLVFAASLAADPSGAWATLRASRWRLGGCVAVTAALLVLMLRFLPAGFPQWQLWQF